VRPSLGHRRNIKPELAAQGSNDLEPMMANSEVNGDRGANEDQREEEGGQEVGQLLSPFLSTM